MSALRVMVPVVAAHARPAAESMAAAAAELRRQEWFDLEDDAEPEAVAAWNGRSGRPGFRIERLRVGS
jgi:hypothetical protein